MKLKNASQLEAKQTIETPTVIAYIDQNYSNDSEKLYGFTVLLKIMSFVSVGYWLNAP